MLAEIITIGDEILIGQVIDSNSAWIARRLNEAGILVVQITSISDDREHIFDALNRARDRADLIIMTGGLGPTRDDITKRTLCEYFDDEFVLDKEVLRSVENYFKSKGREMLDVNRDQALVPSRARAAINTSGTAPGTWIEDHGKVFISLPGVPHEMKKLMTRTFLPWISEYFQTPSVYYRTVLTQGVGESRLMAMINKWEGSLEEEGIKLAYLPSPGKVRLRVGAIGEDEGELRERVDRKVNELCTLLGDIVYGFDEETLELNTGKMLDEKGLTLSTAESCTGGHISHLITSVPGSSRYFKGGVVSYADEVKIRQLGVRAEDIERFGAVSREVVEQMANGIRRRLNTDFAVAVSGIAGPDGGTRQKPVGTVWVAVAGEKDVVSRKFLFGQNREHNIVQSSLTALNMLRKEISKVY